MPASRRLRSLRDHLCAAAAPEPAECSHLCAIDAAAAAEPSPAPLESRSSQRPRHTHDAPQLFDDAEMQAFVRDGYVLLKPSLPEDIVIRSGRGADAEERRVSYNEMICAKADQLQEQGRDMGNNMVPQMPELMTMFDSPEVHGALSSILGQDYYIHLHRHAHTSRGIDEGAGQRMHKDSVGNSRHCVSTLWAVTAVRDSDRDRCEQVDSKRRHHRTRWCMLLYFPQDTPVELGPT